MWLKRKLSKVNTNNFQSLIIINTPDCITEKVRSINIRKKKSHIFIIINFHNTDEMKKIYLGTRAIDKVIKLHT